ncbi:MAG: glycosyltransferase family 9 protein [Ktedonobacteraceae bacterium]
MNLVNYQMGQTDERLSGAYVPGVGKIAVLRANALGDFLFTLPALEALRATYPQAEIVLLGKAWHKAFLQGRPAPIDRVVVVPRYGGVSEEPGIEEDTEEIEHFFHAMEHEHFDLALQMQGGGRYSNVFVRRLGARLTVGSQTPDAQPLDRTMQYVYFQHEVIRHKEIVSLVGASNGIVEPRVMLIGADIDEAQRMVPEGRKPLVALHPGANDPGRRWPTAKFAQVGDALAEAGAQVVVTGTRAERALVEAVVKQMHAPAEGLAGRLSLGGLAGLLARCRVVVSNDTGPRHLAAAVGAATVSIYWCLNLVNSSPLTRARHRPITSWQLECPICGRNTLQDKCEHAVSYVANVETSEVIEHALELFTAE